MSRDLTLLHPKLRRIVPLIIDACAGQGLAVLITDGMRTKEEQDAIWAQGRTKPGVIVTQVQYPNSMHNWGVAVDFCRNVKGREYDDSDNFFARVGYIAKTFGMQWGGDWKNFTDKPHLQLAEYSLDGTTNYLKRVYGSPENFIKTWSGYKDEETPAGGTSSVACGDTFPKGEGKAAGFSDVPANAWYAEALEWAVKAGIIAGYEDGTFRPDGYLTRAQVVSILYRYDAWRQGQKE